MLSTVPFYFNECQDMANTHVHSEHSIKNKSITLYYCVQEQRFVFKRETVLLFFIGNVIEIRSLPFGSIWIRLA